MWASMLRHENMLRRLNISWLTGGASELEKLLLHEIPFIVFSDFDKTLALSSL
jgi:hypothetical protein